MLGPVCLTTLLPTVCIITNSQILIMKSPGTNERSQYWERKHLRVPWWVPVELHQRQEVAPQVQTIREAEPGHRQFRVIIG